MRHRHLPRRLARFGNRPYDVLMPHPVTLPTMSWGTPDAHRTALLVHGLGSSGAQMWRFGVTLAAAGWHAIAVDLRGHGTAPRALDYTITAYAGDLAAIAPPRGGGWDLVIGHSLGGAAVTVAAASRPEWAARLVLIDPAIVLEEADRALVMASEARAFADPSKRAIAAEHPRWHEQDVELKSAAITLASPWAVQATSDQNTPWDVRAAATALRVPTHVIAADPAVYALFHGAVAAEALQNPQVTMSVISGAGHSPHRDLPEATMQELLRALD